MLKTTVNKKLSSLVECCLKIFEFAIFKLLPFSVSSEFGIPIGNVSLFYVPFHVVHYASINVGYCTLHCMKLLVDYSVEGVAKQSVKLWYKMYIIHTYIEEGGVDIVGPASPLRHQIRPVLIN